MATAARTQSWFLLMTIGLLSACSSSDSGDDGDGPALVAGKCATGVDCGPPTSSNADGGSGQVVADAGPPGDGGTSSDDVPDVPPPTGTIIWKDNFDAAPVGALDKAEGDAALGPTVAGTSAATFANASIADDGANGRFIRHNIPAGQLGGFVTSPRLDRETDHATIDYDIRFDKDFDWRWGGKMGPGLVGVTPGTGIYKPTSGNADRNIGFSTRLMWHGRGDDGSRPFQGKLGAIPAGRANDIVTYIYARNPATGFSGFGWHTSLGELTAGSWHHVKLEVKLNTVGQADGIFRVWLDGALAFGATNFDYRNTDKVHIQAVLYDVHRGGGTTPPSWLSSRACQIDIRNIVVADQTP